MHRYSVLFQLPCVLRGSAPNSADFQTHAETAMQARDSRLRLDPKSAASEEETSCGENCTDALPKAGNAIPTWAGIETLCYSGPSFAIRRRRLRTSIPRALAHLA